MHASTIRQTSSANIFRKICFLYGATLTHAATEAKLFGYEKNLLEVIKLSFLNFVDYVSRVVEAPFFRLTSLPTLVYFIHHEVLYYR